MRRNPASAASDTYELNMDTSKNGQPEVFFMLLKHFRTKIDVTLTKTV